MPLRCAIIEDEPLAQELLERYVGRVSALERIAVFDDAVDALGQLPALQPDLLFVDVNLPEMSGIEFLRAYPAPQPLVIMTTANPEYALEGFDLGVVDYLLKPITFARFMKAVGRATARIGQETMTDYPYRSPDTLRNKPDYIYLKTDGRLEQIHHDDIVFIEALGDYVKVHLNGRFLVTHVTMNRLAETLPSDRFLRISRSYIVQKRSIKTLDGNTVTTSTGHSLAIGTNYRDAVKEQIRRWLLT